tara:strand:+ start:356 stop:1414 length:1059 start_codon:yes stop_codon:yes gene_type:complete
MKIPLTIKTLLLTTILASVSISVASAEDAKPSKILDIKAKHCLKTVAAYSMMGPTSTGIYYTFTDKKVVLLVTIDNKSKDFPVSAKIFTFADDATQKGLEGWVNNQHSDALFPDVPNALETHQIPAASCKVISKKLVETTEIRNTEYENYSVEFQLKNVPIIDGIKLNDLSDVAGVNVKKVTDKKVSAKKAYPAHWGNPPLVQTDDYRPLPGGYGMGSGTLAKWITEKMEADKKNPARLKEFIAATEAEILILEKEIADMKEFMTRARFTQEGLIKYKAKLKKKEDRLAALKISIAATEKKAVPTFDAWVKAGKKLPEGMMFTGGTPWFNESTGKNRSAEEVYKIVFGKAAK